jgi:hypothetical protein
MNKRNFGLLSLILFSGMVFLAGCNESLLTGDQIENPALSSGLKNGTLVVKVTDAPFPVSLIKEANVIITKTEIRKTTGNDSTAFVTLREKPDTFNLVKLRNGLTAELVKLSLPAGSYDQIRLYTGDASVLLTDGRMFDLKIPSGPQTGIKMSIDSPIIIEGGVTTELLLDFDLEKSFNVQGNRNTPAGIKGFHFKPVLRAVNNSVAGRLVGSVKNDSAKIIANAKVWLKKDTILTSAFTGADGNYALIGIPAGTYSAFATKTGYDTAMVANVKISAANQTNVNFILKYKK